MAIVGLLLGMLLGAMLGSLFDSTVAGMLVGGLLGVLLLRGNGGKTAEQALQETGQLRALLAEQQKCFDLELAQLRARIAALEGSGIEAAPPTEAAQSPATAEAETVQEISFEVEDVVTAQPELPSAAKPEPVLPSAPPVCEPKPAEPVLSQTAPVTIEATPNFIEHAFTAAKDWLFGGNTLVRVGVLLVFLGLAFLLRYASERFVIPVELRYIGVVATALVGLGLGWRLRESRRAYALLLQGASVGVMYLTIFAAMRLHHILPLHAGFALLVLVAVSSAVLAVAQDALALAVAGSLGGFAAPILASTGGGNHVALFSYFALLNAGILGMAWFKAWRPLNLVGFFSTFLIGLAWGLRSYVPVHYASTQFFVILFFLMFVGIGLLFARRVLLDDPAAPERIGSGEWWRWVRQHGGDWRRYVDGTLLFGAPLAGFSLQYALVRESEYGAAFSALALGVFYMLLARLLYSRTQAALRLLVEVFLALGVVFASLAIPLALDAQWTAAAWAVEAAGIYWVGHRQGRALGRGFALLLQTGALFAWLSRVYPGTESLLSGPVLGALLLGLAFLCNALSLRMALQDEERAACWDKDLLPVFNTLGLWFLYLIAPLTLKAQGTAVAWALAGLVTVYLGLRLQARAWIGNALAVQALAGLVFLTDIRHGAGGLGVLVFGGSGWRGIAVASLVGGTVLYSAFLAIRAARANGDERFERRMGWLTLFGLVFLVLAVLFILPWASATGVWAGCGFFLLVLALWLALKPVFWFALALQLVAGAAYVLTGFPRLLASPLADRLLPAFAHSGFWTPAVIALAAFCVAWRLVASDRPEAGEPLGNRIALPALVWSTLWWAFAWWAELSRLLPAVQAGHVFLGVMAVTVLVWSRLAAHLAWGALVGMGGALLPLAALVALTDFARDWHPFGQWGWLGFGLVLAAHLALLARAGLLRESAERALHLAGCWTGLLVLSLELRHVFLLLSQPGSAWRWLGWVLPLALWLLWSGWRSAPRYGPTDAHPTLYRYTATLPVFLLLMAWAGFSALKSAGNPAPLPFIPLVNPLEIAQVLVLYAGWHWLAELETEAEDPPQFAGAASALRWLLYVVAFAAYTMLVLRAVHQLGGVAWRTEALLRSMTAQASLSLAWSVLALGLMIAGHRLGRRWVWITGAALVAVVVAKLFLVELSQRGGVERIVSFLGVGVLLLVVGYFAPLPPAADKEKT
ncbi:Uncharacterized membrane protein [Formivibrio citricus]|uniref:Uncharacterized membrane protein n=1 Tax=Formivibrio citricus TaxID=83765 RepID=A0A1I4WKD0_9NEIS|nr:DUF2339 domain-containing protein [Formivibrio citricus]SFN13915.1 Uncharacterized membrane protein [Formivibrio citricus]